MIKHEEIASYLIKCFMCDDISLRDDIKDIHNIEWHKCEKCISEHIKNEKIDGKIDCSCCKNSEAEKNCVWFCNECLKKPYIVKDLHEKKLLHDKLNKKYAEKVIRLS